MGNDFMDFGQMSLPALWERLQHGLDSIPSCKIHLLALREFISRCGAETSDQKQCLRFNPGTLDGLVTMLRREGHGGLADEIAGRIPSDGSLVRITDALVGFWLSQPPFGSGNWRPIEKPINDSEESLPAFFRDPAHRSLAFEPIEKQDTVEPMPVELPAPIEAPAEDVIAKPPEESAVEARPVKKPRAKEATSTKRPTVGKSEGPPKRTDPPKDGGAIASPLIAAVEVPEDTERYPAVKQKSKSERPEGKRGADYPGKHPRGKQPKSKRRF